MRKPRVLIVSAVIPAEGSGGGCLAMKRHFLDRDDFEIAVASQNEQDLGDIPFQVLRRSRLSHRIRRSRCARIYENVEQWINWWMLPRDLVSFAEKFQPDLIFSVVDDWHMGLAWQLSQQLTIPLAVNFQDLFALSQFVPKDRRPFALTRRRSLRKYRMLNCKADAVFHTSEGMKKWFTPSVRGVVLYPIGGKTDDAEAAATPVVPSNVIRLVYAGNCYGAYGRMLLQLANECIRIDSKIQLNIYSQGNDWRSDDVERFRNGGIYLGSLPFMELQEKLSKADAFLTVMSFEEAESSFVRTSFTTKWLDYAPHGKPIFVWGPAYCSAAVFAAMTKAGVVIGSRCSESVVAAVDSLQRDADKWIQQSHHARTASVTCLAADEIHEILIRVLNDTLLTSS